MMSKQVYDIIDNQEGYQADYLWSGGAKSFNDINKKSFGKILAFVKLIVILLYRFISGRRYQIAYLTFAPWTHAALRDGLLAWLAGLSSQRVLVHLHGEGLQKVVDQADLKHKLLARLVKNSELIAITSASVDIGQKSALFSKAHYLPNFVSIPQNMIDQSPYKQPNTEKQRPLQIVFLGNLDPRKGVLQFLEFVAVLKAEGLPVIAKIVGAPTQFLSAEDVLQAGEKLDISDILSVPGAKYGQEKIDFLLEGDIFLYPSKHDYAPLVLIEAMALKTVPIAYDTGGIAEILGPDFATHIISPKAVLADQNQQIIELVRRYCTDDKQLQKDKITAYKLFQNRFTRKIFTSNFSTILQSSNEKTN